METQELSPEEKQGLERELDFYLKMRKDHYSREIFLVSDPLGDRYESVERVVWDKLVESYGGQHDHIWNVHDCTSTIPRGHPPNNIFDKLTIAGERGKEIMIQHIEHPSRIHIVYFDGTVLRNPAFKNHFSVHDCYKVHDNENEDCDFSYLSALLYKSQICRLEQE